VFCVGVFQNIEDYEVGGEGVILYAGKHSILDIFHHNFGLKNNILGK
jgi:hypothetical protein